MERLSILLIHVISTEEPFLRLGRDLLAMTIDLDIESAMRDEVGDNDCGRHISCKTGGESAGVRGPNDGWHGKRETKDDTKKGWNSENVEGIQIRGLLYPEAAVRDRRVRSRVISSAARSSPHITSFQTSSIIRGDTSEQMIP
jgi:hypothetical protein